MDWQKGMVVDHAKDKPEDMDMDLWILIQQFQGLIGRSQFVLLGHELFDCHNLLIF